MKHHEGFQIAFWFLRTGSLHQAVKQVTGKDYARDDQYTRLSQSKEFAKGIQYWLQQLGRVGMAFQLKKAEEGVDTVLEDLKDRMLHATFDEYPTYASIYTSMMSLFGGNWSEFDKSTPSNTVATIFASSPVRQLKPAKQFEGVENAEVEQ